MASIVAAHGRPKRIPNRVPDLRKGPHLVLGVPQLKSAMALDQATDEGLDTMARLVNSERERRKTDKRMAEARPLIGSCWYHDELSIGRRVYRSWFKVTGVSQVGMLECIHFERTNYGRIIIQKLSFWSMESNGYKRCRPQSLHAAWKKLKRQIVNSKI